jgi:hypothetical protein
MLDVTKSMNTIPAHLAQRSLPTFMRLIMQCGIFDPQLLFGGVGDHRCGDRSPLQVGQFESEEKLIDRWLTALHREGGGGGTGLESYELALWLAARHMSCDCFEKRGQRGYLFLTGDELPYSHVARSDVLSVFGEDIGADVPIEQVIAEAARMWHIFFLIPDPYRAQSCERHWRNLLGDAVAVLEIHEDTCLAAAALMAMTEGLLPDLNAVGHKLDVEMQVGRDQTNRVIRAIEPYAASIGCGGPRRPAEPVTALPTGSRPSRTRRIQTTELDLF